ncbi:MAG: hypothetical protein ACOCRL_00455 [Bacillota bacterium]
MRVVLWIFAIVLCIIIFSYGNTTYYRYEQSDGWGYSFEQSQGKEIIRNSKTYEYVGTRQKFDKNPEARAISIAVILFGTYYFSNKLKNKNRKNSDTNASNVTGNEINNNS